MTVSLGKRKRRPQSRSDLPDEQATPEHLHALFQAHFEAQYEPLEPFPVSKASTRNAGSASASDDNDDDDQSEDEWEGIVSSGEDGDAVEVVTLAAYGPAGAAVPDEERKTFMSAKPPCLRPAASARPAKAAESREEERSAEAALLKNDRALQQLLQESHLLSSPSAPHGPGQQQQDSLQATGKTRHKALDLRMQALGARSSLLEQKKMPMAHRAGIERKKRLREEGRRKEARENDVVLEREKRKEKKPVRRDRGVGAPSVGTFRGGTLSLSRKDVEKIQGPRMRKGAGRGRGGKRR